MSKKNILSYSILLIVSVISSSFLTLFLIQDSRIGYRYSDERLKESIVNISYGAAELEQLRPVSFNWKGRTSEGVKLGFIAQEVQKVLPELVSEDSKGMMMVDYGALVPVLVKVINEQQLIIEEQSSDIDELKYNVSQLRK